MTSAPSNNLLLINASDVETRVALVEEGKLAEIHFERESSTKLVGNIYKARVGRVVPGIQASFLDAGLEKALFLYAGDIISDPEYAVEMRKTLLEAGTDPHALRTPLAAPRIEKFLRPGQEVVVQIMKDPIGTKGARASMYVSLPGRYLVLVPGMPQIAISRRISDESRRKALEALIEKIRPEQFGFIVRTAAGVAPEKSIEHDLNELVRRWKVIESKISMARAPEVVYEEPPVYIKTVRDLYTHETERILCDQEETMLRLRNYLDHSMPEASEKLELYAQNELLFDAFGVEVDLAKALARKVWLPSGGSIVVDQTEALTAFDVNTGRFVGKANVRETILQTNLEAAIEIAKQLRLRNIGGIIVIDFIDMAELEDRLVVSKKLTALLEKDKAKTNVLAISDLGLVQMTRQRSSISLEKALMNECSECEGTGYIKSKDTLCLELLREVQRYKNRLKLPKIEVRVRQDLLEHLKVHFVGQLNRLSEDRRTKVRFVAQKDPHSRDPFELSTGD